MHCFCFFKPTFCWFCLCFYFYLYLMLDHFITFLYDFHELNVSKITNIWRQILCVQGSSDGPEQYVFYNLWKFYYYFYIFCTSWLSFYSEGFSPLFQICCNHEFNILSTAFNGMQLLFLTCLMTNLFIQTNFGIVNG